MEYPQTMIALMEAFHSEEQCLAFLEEIRWWSKCPHCWHGDFWRSKIRRTSTCKSCHSVLSVTADTVLHRVRIPLRAIFLMAWLMVTSKQGISDEELAHILCISGKTTWLWHHKFRQIMVLWGRSKLTWDVEVDEVFVWGKKAGKRGRWAEGKLIVIMAVEINREHLNVDWLYRGMGRVRMQVIEDCSSHTLKDFIQNNIETGSTIYTDKWSGYNGIEKEGYRHILQEAPVGDKVDFPGIESSEVTPNVHIIASLLKRWLLGTHQKYCTKDGYLQEYLEEYTFRFNRRTSWDRGKLFKILIEQILTLGPTTMEWLRKKRKQTVDMSVK